MAQSDAATRNKVSALLRSKWLDGHVLGIGHDPRPLPEAR
jgi:hypothetical protein